VNTDDHLVFTGAVLEAHRGDMYLVDCTAGALRRRVLAKRCGRLIQNKIRLISGDRVEVEVSPYCLERGRITRRLKE
jgi:translation initiation factor IF-1